MTPTADIVRAARKRAGLTQTEAARVAELGCVQRWSEYERGITTIDLARWQWFLARVGQHPDFILVVRPEPASEPSGRLARIAADAIALA